jgi:hypothetical protein
VCTDLCTTRTYAMMAAELLIPKSRTLGDAIEVFESEHGHDS